MYKTLLLAYDGSLEGRMALEEGLLIAKAFRAETHLLTVIKPKAVSIAGQYQENEDETEHFKAILQEGVKRLEDGDLKTISHLEFGDPAEEIAKLVLQVHADLVVLGHRHRGLLSQWWRIPTSMSLLDRVNCSILINMHSS